MTEQPGRPLTDEAHWRRVWDRIRVTATAESSLHVDLTFDPILTRYLPSSSGMRALELGCYPGTYMAYLHKRFGYRVSGLDFLDDLESIRPQLQRLGVSPERLIQANFLTAELGEKWDVVASFGLVEHFVDTELVVERHCRLVADGGYLVIELPHFGGAQHALHRKFDARNLAAHNVDSMRPELYDKLLQERGFHILTCGYFRTFDFDVSHENNPLVEQKALSLRLAYKASWVAKTALRLTRLENVPNRWFSPYIVVVARKKPR